MQYIFVCFVCLFLIFLPPRIKAWTMLSAEIVFLQNMTQCVKQVKLPSVANDAYICGGHVITRAVYRLKVSDTCTDIIIEFCHRHPNYTFFNVSI